MNENQTFNTNSYTISRKENGEIERHFESGSIEPELTVEYYTSRLEQLEDTYLETKANLQAQKEKLEGWLVDNPLEEEINEEGEA